MADLQLSVVLAALDKASGPLGKIAAASSKASSALQGAQRELRALGQQGKALDLLSQQQGKLAALGKQMDETRAKIAHLRSQMAGTTGANRSQLAREIDAATASIKKMGAQETVLRGQVQATGAALRAAGVDATTHANKVAAAEAKISQAGARMARQAKITRMRERLNAGAANVGRGAVAVSANVGIFAAPLVMMTKTAAKFEQFQTVLETVEGSSEKAKQSMAWVNEFAAKTPYEIDAVMESFVKLRTYGIDPTKGTLRSLGDTASAMGKPLMQTVEAMADAMTGEFERLKEFGIRGAAIQGTSMATLDYVDKAGKQQQVTVDKGNREALRSTLETIWNSRYGGAMDKMSGTWNGMVSNLSDQWTRMQLLIMSSGLFARMKGGLAELLGTINRMAESGELAALAGRIGEFFNTFMTGASSGVTAMVQLASAINTVLTPFVWIIQRIAEGAATVVMVWSAARDALTAQWNSLPAWFRALIAQLPAALAGLAGQFFSAGSAMIQGLYNGISSKFAAARAFVAEQASALAAAARNALGIQSPSTVFRLIGVQTIRGLELGIASRAAAAVGNTQYVVRRVAAAGAGLALGTGAALVPAAPLTAPGPLARPASVPSAPGQWGGDTIQITINAQGMDARALAQEISRTLDARDREKAARGRSVLRDRG